MYTVLWNFAAKTSQVTISARALADCTVYHVDAVRLALNWLHARGWIKRYVGDRSSGHFTPDTYVVFSHDEWAQVNGEECKPPRPPGAHIDPVVKTP